MVGVVLGEVRAGHDTPPPFSPLTPNTVYAIFLLLCAHPICRAFHNLDGVFPQQTDKETLVKGETRATTDFEKLLEA